MEDLSVKSDEPEVAKAESPAPIKSEEAAGESQTESEPQAESQSEPQSEQVNAQAEGWLTDGDMFHCSICTADTNESSQLNFRGFHRSIFIGWI